MIYIRASRDPSRDIISICRRSSRSPVVFPSEIPDAGQGQEEGGGKGIVYAATREYRESLPKESAEARFLST